MVRSIGQNFIRFDIILFNLASSKREGIFFKSFYKSLSWIGNGPVYAIVALLELVIGIEDGRRMVWAALIAFGLELPIYYVLKTKVKRLRPFEHFPKIKNLIQAPDRYSFPSGHAAAAFLFARIVSFQLPELVLPLFLIAGLIGYSRIYLRVHFPLDVLFGMLLGLTCAEIAITMVF
ncbi:phosphoesterase PA-phosphatase related protein [Caldithrix abyssi DSM 13497]|uniref:Phosphoesterase PA-phosphatase related protein n=1 Tax=Caldithrix abyssi DSM 13497 TaxID=880073 RepID=H1XNG5_CALAY|nr:phosphatase PAP2 family protein [Caldithrix abyssi]APF18098.1 undecaprenyl-diphosphatase [Caldithrix abyssi DSM 13497]EHO42136.1 phosphoesterase PA-phosphatase related protein [Caldithrix abyssi DSM 13497]